MALSARLTRTGLALALALGAVAVQPDAVAAQTPPPVPTDVRPLAAEIDAWRMQEVEKLRGTPKNTREYHRLIDELARSMGRGKESVREEALRKIFEKAGVPQPTYTGTGPADPGSGGVLGDQDLASLSPREYDKVMKAATDLNYTVSAKGDSMTIQELQVTGHRQPPENFGPAGSSANETAAIGRASNKETAVSFGIDPDPGLPITRDAHLNTLDNLKKAGDLLGKDPATFTLKDWADWAKMVGRNMDAAGIKDAPLRTMLEDLKIRDTPDSAGVTPLDGTPAERAKAIKEFVARANEVNRKAYATTKAQSAKVEAALRRQIDVAADAAARSQAKAKLNAYLNEQHAARRAVVQNQDGQVLLDLDGLPPGKRPKLSPSQVAERAVEPSRKKLVEAVRSSPDPVVPVKAPSRLVRYSGPIMTVFGAVQAALEGANLAQAQAQPGEGFLTTAARGTGYGVLYTLGIPDAFRIGTDAGNESMQRYIAELAAGKDPSLAWAKLRGAGTGVYVFAKGMLVDSAVMLAESGGSFAGAAWTARQAQLDQLAAEQAQSQKAVAIARNLARDLAATVKAANAEIAMLRPLTAQVEETRRTTNQLQATFDRLQTAIDTHCRRAAGGTAAPASRPQAADPTLPAELADIATQGDLVCRAADQAVAEFKRQQITAQGVAFRLDNAVRRPQQEAERRLDAARENVDAMVGAATGDAALLQVAERAVQEAAAVAQQAYALAASSGAAAALLQQKVTALRTSATRVNDMRQRFVDGVRRFYGVSPEQDAELRGLVQDASPLTIDAAGISEIDAAARALAALSAQLTKGIAARVPPPCPALAALAARWAAIWQQHGDLKPLLDDAANRVAVGRSCLDRLSALVPSAPTVPTPAPSPSPAPGSDSARAKLLPEVMKAVMPRLGFNTWKPMPQDLAVLGPGAYMVCGWSEPEQVSGCHVYAFDRAPSAGVVLNVVRLRLIAGGPAGLKAMFESMQQGRPLPMIPYRGQPFHEEVTRDGSTEVGEEWNSARVSTVFAPGLVIRVEHTRGCYVHDPETGFTRRDRATGKPLRPCPAISTPPSATAELDAVLDEAVKARLLPPGTIK